MVFLSALILASRAALIAAAPATFPPGQLPVRPDKVFSFGNGHADSSIPTIQREQHIPASGHNANPAPRKRGGTKNDIIIIPDPDTEPFLDWDIPLSPTLCSNGGYYNNIQLTETTTITNTIAVSGGFDVKVIKNVLGARFGVDYSKSWSIGKSTSLTGYVEKGKCGKFVVNPWTWQTTGRVWSGVVGESEGDAAGSIVSEYKSNRYTDSPGVKEWVNGTYSVCQYAMANTSQPSINVPIHRCLGDGYM